MRYRIFQLRIEHGGAPRGGAGPLHHALPPLLGIAPLLLDFLDVLFASLLEQRQFHLRGVENFVLFLQLRFLFLL